ncbi:hypothetical protein [uncultured Ruegeria sp.]|uniref:hypothetical protein n=1 Tax=uncultured Ruegeria sp. TaxID=259304 RepID=UPI002631D465|nr:hypothetical protein [uncultured Ruegeria sp.]
MKTFITAAILSTTVLAAPAMAMGVDMTNLTRNLSFPTTVSEPVTQDKVKPGN